jgi:hypothetical protein
VPSIGLVVAGDAVYNGIHPFLNESNSQTRLQWLAALDKIDILKPLAVVAGHKIPTNDDSPRNVEETRQYIRNFIRLNDATKTSRELYDRMLELYPDRACAFLRFLSGALQLSPPEPVHEGSRNPASVTTHSGGISFGE